MSEIRQTASRRPAAIRHFTELIVWQKAHAAGLEIFRPSKAWPVEARYALTGQVRRSSRSIGANIAEAWGKRRYEAAFLGKLTDADAEAHETEQWLINAQDHGYSTAEQLGASRALLVEVGKMLGSMINNPTPFLTKI